MAAVKTVRVVDGKGSKVINATDYDPKTDTLYAADKPKIAQPTRKQKKTN